MEMEVSDSSNPKLLMFSDIEGCQINSGTQSTFLCSNAFYDELINKLKGDPNLNVAFLGDYFDQGLGVFNSINKMHRLLITYPERVHVILGNRDVNKLRFMFELKNEVRGLSANENRWGVWSKYYDNLSGKTGVELVKHILSTSMGAGISNGEKMVGLHSFVPVAARGKANDETAYNYLLAAFGMSDSKPEFQPLPVLDFFNRCKIAHVFNGKVLLAHGGGFDPQAFFGQKYVDSFTTDDPITSENYHKLLNDFRVKLSSLPDDNSYHVSVEDSVNVYNKLLKEVLDQVSKGEFTWKFVLLQALGLKPDTEDARYKSLIQSCSQDGCSGKNEDLKYDPESKQLAEVLSKSGITHVSYGHKPVCFPIPLIYQRTTIPGVTFISNDTSNGNRKISEIGSNTAFGTSITFKSDGSHETQVEVISLNGESSPALKYSAMFGPFSSENIPPVYMESPGQRTKLIFKDKVLSFNNLLKPPASFGQLEYSDNITGGKRRSRNRKRNTKKRGSKRLSKRTNRRQEGGGWDYYDNYIDDDDDDEEEEEENDDRGNDEEEEEENDDRGNDDDADEPPLTYNEQYAKEKHNSKFGQADTFDIKRHRLVNSNYWDGGYTNKRRTKKSKRRSSNKKRTKRNKRHAKRSRKMRKY
jgi:hypothetical protein